MKKSKKETGKPKFVGIMGGTFDPIHYGHLSVAETVRHSLGLDYILFIPAGNPVFKQNKKVSDKEHRFLMTFLAVSNNPYFKVSRLELDREGITFTVDTMRELKNDHPLYKFVFITGADSFLDILGWRNIDELIQMTEFAVVNRPGYDNKKLLEVSDTIYNKYNKKINFVEVPPLDISSSMIRSLVKTEKSIKYLLPLEVESYILKNRIYSMDNYLLNIDAIIKKVRKIQSEKRLTHTLKVAEEAKKLAAYYGENPDKAYLTGILHDIAKSFSEEKLYDKIVEYNIDVDDLVKRKLNLAHSWVGAEVAKSEFNINDEDILNAIRFHTTGRPGMSLLEKIIFVADFTEPSRSWHKGIDKAREYAYKDLDAAVITILEEKISFNKTNEIHPLSRMALDYMEYHYQYDKEDI